MPVRVFDAALADCEETSSSRVVRGLEWILEQHSPNGPAHGQFGVVNLSLGGEAVGASNVLDTHVKALMRAGLIVVAAAGNSGNDACEVTPANIPGVLTVAASDRDDGMATSSNLGTCVDLFAPGMRIISAWIGGTESTAELSGTSMSAPHVSGVAAIIYSLYSGVSEGMVRSNLLGVATQGVISGPDTQLATATPDRLLFLPSASAGFVSLTPARLLDTRLGEMVGEVDGSGDVYELQVTGVKGVPSSGVSAVALNVTAVSTVAGDYGGFVTVFPCGKRPDASNLNFRSGQTVPNAVIAPVSSTGTVCFYVYGTAHLLVDVSGYLPWT